MGGFRDMLLLEGADILRDMFLEVTDAESDGFRSERGLERMPAWGVSLVYVSMYKVYTR